MQIPFCEKQFTGLQLIDVKLDYFLSNSEPVLFQLSSVFLKPTLPSAGKFDLNKHYVAFGISLGCLQDVSKNSQQYGSSVSHAYTTYTQGLETITQLFLSCPIIRFWKDI